MGILISCEDMWLEYPTRVVMRGVTLGVAEGDRRGIVGKNGDGKSTLLNLLSNRLEPDRGSRTLRRNLRIGLLGQNDTLNGDMSVGEAVIGNRETHEWAGDAKIRKIIAELLGDVDWDAKVNSLSGGQRRRCDLARLLIEDWDVLALDEPTNHLDMKGITWLAHHLNTRWAPGQGALLIVTHDRWFLDEVCTSMWEVHDGKVEPFEGGYSAYIQQRVERDRQARATEERRQNILRKELAWLARGPQARATKPKFRVEAARDLIANDPPPRNTLELKRLAMTRLGKQVIELKNVTLSYGDNKVLNKTNWIVGPGDRWAILGSNGAGKTSLLRMIEGKILPTSGIVKIGQTVRIGVLSQRLDELEAHTGETVKDTLKTVKSRYTIDGKEYTSTQLLEQLGFEKGQLLTRVEELSGGQKRRLQLLLVLLSEPNVLILDEPGNDMDTDMLAVLEDLLDSWPGTLLLVSHDRYLVERVTDSQYMLMGGDLVHVPKGVDGFLEALEAQEKEQSKPAPVTKPVQTAGTVQQPSQSTQLPRAEEYKLRKQLASVERKLETQHELTEKVKKQMLEANATDFEQLGKYQKQLEDIAGQIEALELEWLDLNEQLGI
ncbi:MAG: ABC-F family ATP-binding cassette domain-containing protein [Coriobacteriales bacterium]|nr:ABC-F family ATP-binding cassette domain-containing protein [Coriobacteriales bacterium]